MSKQIEAIKLAKRWLERNTYGDEAVDVYDALCEALEEQEPVQNGATHYQPHQKAYYKRVSATEWYLWSCTGNGWIPSKGTSDSCDWIMLSPLTAPQPVKTAESEPVAYKITGKLGVICSFHGGVNVKKGDLVYTSPPASRPWVGLTDEQIVQLSLEWPAETNDWASHIDFARAIEAKLKERNT